MARYRQDIDKDKEAQIKSDISNGLSIENAALKYGISYTLARQIHEGSRGKPFTPPEYVYRYGVLYKRTEIEEDLICTNCGKRPKAPGNRFLCTKCQNSN